MNGKMEEKKVKGVDLPMLIRTRNEIIYRLTELYLPKSEQQRKKMLEFNIDKMKSQNDNENDDIRRRRRDIKNELKNAKQALMN